MRRLKNYSLAGNPEKPLLTYRDRNGTHTVSLHAGGMHDAQVEVFRDADATYVLNLNARLPYVGMEHFLGSQRQGQLFLSGEKALEDVLGERGLELTPLNMAKKLLAHVRALSKAKDDSPVLESHSPNTHTFEIHLEDLNDEARQRYLEFVRNDPTYGPLAIIEVQEEMEGHS